MMPFAISQVETVGLWQQGIGLLLNKYGLWSTVMSSSTLFFLYHQIHSLDCFYGSFSYGLCLRLKRNPEQHTVISSPGSLHLNLHVNNVLTQLAASGIKTALRNHSNWSNPPEASPFTHPPIFFPPTEHSSPIWFLFSPGLPQCLPLFLKPLPFRPLLVWRSCLC